MLPPSLLRALPPEPQVNFSLLDATTAAAAAADFSKPTTLIIIIMIMILTITINLYHCCFILGNHFNVCSPLM